MEAILTLIIILIMLILLITERYEPVLVFFGVSVTFVVLKIITVDELVLGFSNQAVLILGGIFILADCIKKTQYLQYLTHNIVHRLDLKKTGLLSLYLPIMLFSAFCNNTPVVAMYIPVLKSLDKKVDKHYSKLLLPLSYFSIFGGLLTLVGTSTNLLISGLLVDSGYSPLEMFTLTKVTIFLVIAGSLYILSRLDSIPVRNNTVEKVKSNSREYMIAFEVKENSNLIGKSVENAGLRNLEGVYLLEIKRKTGEIITPVTKNDLISSKDILIFVGKINNISKLRSLSGIKLLSSNEDIELESLGNKNNEVVEVVVSEKFPYLWKSVKESNFRKNYESAIIAIIRNGKRIVKKIGDIKLKPGDTLLLISKKGFFEKWQDSDDFYLMNTHKIDEAISKKNSQISVMVFIFIIILSILHIMPILNSIFLGVALLFFLGIVHPKSAVKMIDWNTIIIIVLSLGIGKAILKSGSAEILANVIVDSSKFLGTYGTLALVYCFTNILTEMITNNAAAVLAYPVALEVSNALGVDFMPFVVVVAIAASASFSTPYGYHTNLMVTSHGGYKFKDFIKIGLPLNIIFLLLTTVLVPIFF